MSDGDFAEILEKLDSPEDIARNLPEYLPKFIEIFEDKYYDSYNLKILTTLLGPVAASIDPVDLEKELLVIFLPSVNTAFESALDEVVSLLENNSQFEEENAINLSKYLQLCLNVIDGYYELIALLGKMKTLEVGSVSTVIKVLPPVLKTVFLHCHGSEELYACYFSESTTVLSAMFIRSYQLYLNFCKLLESSVLFNVTYEEDIAILAQTAEIMCSINDIVIKLDTKATALVWKHFAAIVCKYSRDLKERLNMQQPVTCLCTSITEAITRLIDLIVVENNDDKTRETTLKLGNFLFKILIRVCELYESYLDDCFLPIFHVLVKLCSCSRSPGIKCKEREELNRFISVASATLIKILLGEDQFRKVVENELEQSFELDRIGTFFFTILLVRKISQEPKKHKKWFDYPFVERAITLYESCGYLIDGSSVVEGMNSYFFIVYTIGLFILSPSYSSLFSRTEKFLVQKLVAQNTETAVLSSDILCFVCRNANEQYCDDLTSVLWKYLVSWTSSQWRPEYIIVGCTFKRLCRSLPSTRQELYCSKDPRLIRWSGISEPLPSVELDLSGEADNFITKVNQLSFSFNLGKFQVDDFVKVVQTVVNPPFCGKWKENLVIAILRLTAKNWNDLSPAQREVAFDYLLQSFLNESAQMSSRLKIAVCRFLIAIFDSSTVNCLTDTILSQVFYSLLDPQDNSLVFLRGVLLIISVPSDSKNVLETLSWKDSNVHRMLASYFDQVLPDDDVLVATSTAYCHKCIKLEEGILRSPSEPAAKKIKMSEANENTELRVIVCRLKDDLSKIKDMFSDNPFPSAEVKDILSECAKDFEFLRNLM